jgi:hypothetical protein
MDIAYFVPYPRQRSRLRGTVGTLVVLLCHLSTHLSGQSPSATQPSAHGQLNAPCPWPTSNFTPLSRAAATEGSMPSAVRIATFEPLSAARRGIVSSPAQPQAHRAAAQFRGDVAKPKTKAALLNCQVRNATWLHTSRKIAHSSACRYRFPAFGQDKCPKARH